MAQNIGFLNFGIDGDDKAIKAKIDALKKDAVSIEQIFKNIKIDSEGSLSKDTQKAQLSADKLAVSNAKVAQSISDMERASVRLSNEKARSAEIDSRTAVNSLRQATEKQRQDEVALNMEIRKQRVNNVTAESMARKAAIEQKMQEQSMMNEARLEGIRKRNEEIGKRGQENFRKAVDGANQSLHTQNNILTNLEKKLIGVFSTYQITRFAKEIVNVRGEFQGLELAFTTMLGSAEKSRKMMIDVTSLALESPYTVTEVASNTKQLIAMGIQAEKAMDTMKALGDVSAGLSVPMWRIAINYGQVSALGRLQAREIRDFAMAGVPIVEELAKQLGKTTGEITDLVSAGRIGFPEVEKAFQSMAGEGGKFHNMMEKQNSTVKGQMNRLEDQVELMMNSIGKSNEGAIYSTIGMASTLVENYEKVGKTLGALIITYGTYKAAVIAVNTVQSLQSKIALETALAGKQLTISQGLQAVATKDLSRAQMALNKTMLANPYVLIATLAIGTATAMWALHDSTSSAERAQKDFSKQQEKFNANLEEEINSTNKLVSLAKEKEVSDDNKIGAIKELIKEYPQLLYKYKSEYDILKNILDVEKEIQDIRTGKSRASNELEFEKYDKLYKDQRVKNSRARVSSSDKEKEQEYKAKRDLYQKAVADDVYNSFMGDLDNLTEKELDEYTTRIAQKVKEGNQKIELEIGRHQGYYTKAIYSLEDAQRLLDSLTSVKDARENSTTYKEDYEAAQKNWREAKKVLEEIEKDKDRFSKEQYEEAKKRLDATETSFKNLGGKTKETKSKKETADIDVQSQKREQEDLAFQLAQAKIDADKKGSEKVIAQIKLNQKKELLALDRNKEDYLKKKIAIEKSIFESDSKNKDKKFDTSSVKLSVGESEMFDNLTGATNEKYSNQLSAVYADLLTKYQGYTEKRLEAQKKFQTDRENLVKAGAPKESLDENKYQEEETLKAIDNEFAMREDSFQNWIDSIANIGIEELRKRLVEAKKELERMEFLTPNNPELATQRAKVNKLDALTDKPELKASPGKRSIKEWGDLYKVLGKVDKQFEEIGDSIGGTTGKILKGAGGITTATLQMVDSIIMIGEGSTEAMVGASTAAATAIKTVEKASVILAIIGAALQIATKITDMFAADYSKYEKAKENYESYVEVLDQVIDKQKELIETMTGQAAVEASDRARELVEKQVEAARKIGRERLDSGSSAGSHSIGVRQRKRMDDSDWADVRKAIGYNAAVEKGRMHGLFDLSVEQLESLKEEAPAFWSKLDEDVRTYLEQIIKGKESIKDINNAINESFTQVSFESFRDEFLDTLLDMDIGVKEFVDNFGEQMTKALLNLSMGEVIDNDLRKLYDAWSKELQNSDGELSKEQISQYKKEYEDMVKKMFAEREKIFELTGYADGNSSKSTLSKGIQEVTEDTASLLASYINSMRADVAVTKEQLLKIVQMAQYSQASLGGMLAQLLLIQTNTLNTANNTQRANEIAEKTFDLLKSATTNGGITQFNVR